MEFYLKGLQDFQDLPIVQASTWTFRTVRDLRSVAKKGNVLTASDRAAIFLEGCSPWLCGFPSIY